MNYRQESLKKHAEWRGKIETAVRVPTDSREALSLAYTPGVAEPCLAIAKDPEKSFELTRRWNTVPVITDGTAVLGLGDIGPEAGMPVMEGKCALFKAYGGVDAFPICIKSKDVDEIVNTIKLISGSFGGINLEDISAPRCFEIETRLKNELDIPVFHDDQHGTAIVMAAALINAAKVVGKSVDALRVVINGAGAAGIAIAKYLLNLGVADIVLCDKFGVIVKGQSGMNAAQAQMAEITNKSGICGTLSDAMKGADVFIGVSAPNVVSKDMVRSMAKGAIVFSCANPVPEISREDALEAGAAVVGTGSSEKPNQINNVLVFPGLFRGALDARAKDITADMMIAASKAIAACVGDKLSADYILPYAYDKSAHEAVAKAVYAAAKV
ncbi:MAG TPA: NADP-dependent malic enzyme [Candidatus Coproplasma excrementigallinarum]|uniref:NADP-dependent malic enzyme n=1 Tax=Candidatus Coproplasma excrementigallinarum TaxID=2840747 RepID=A0A9D1SIN0_9FIRM|nr:NADP-dependent malic enzyme [Candidatus Coproplasma excrementigallinarum]